MESTEIRLSRLHKCTFEQALELMNRGFEGYYVDTTCTMNEMLSHFAVHGIRPELSVVANVNDRPVGFVFIAIKIVNGVKLAWNGGTGVFPENRGMGIAKAMMQEAQRIICEQKVNKALLEVRTINTHAISAYERGGFRIVDRMIGMSRTEPLKHPFYEGKLPDFMQLIYGKPSDIVNLPFYRNNAAWGSQWHNIIGGESLTICDTQGQAMGYALFKRSFEENGKLKSIILYQCEVDPTRTNREDLFRCMLHEVYGPFDAPCVRETSDLLSHSELISLLTKAGLTTNHEQYLMIQELNS